jgi:hypothetical protein
MSFPLMPDHIKAELDALDKRPELAPTPWPFRGHRDFRRFTQDDYDNFGGGIFNKVTDPTQIKWFGGRIKANVALAKLQSLGYFVRFSTPSIVDVGNETDGYDRIRNEWYHLFFAPISKP